MNNNGNSAYRQNGFTLIELIVVFTVIAILSTIGTVSFVSYSRTQTLNQATSDLVQTLNLAKSLSASQLKTPDINGSGPLVGCSSSQTLGGYGVQINVDQTNKVYSYNLYIRCYAGGVKLPLVTYNRWQTILPKDVLIVLIGSETNMDIFFPVLSGGIISTGGYSIVLKSAYSGPSPKTIDFSQGYISINKQP